MTPLHIEHNAFETERRIRGVCRTILTEGFSADTDSLPAPNELWRLAANSGLMGVGLPESFGGKGGGMVSISIAARVITEIFMDTGFSLSWLIHMLVSRLIADFGTDAQKKTFLPSLIKGEKSGSFAISEPEKGPHPKYLKTTAERSGNHFFLSGEKSFVTNGPMAGFFIVIAVTKEIDGKKFFSALIVPKETDGLSFTETPPFPFFKTCAHGGIRLNRVCVPAQNLLGPIDRAYETLVMPFAEMESALMTGVAAGGFLAMKASLLNALKAFDAMPPPSDTLCLALGELEALLHVAGIVSERLAAQAFPANVSTDSLFLLIFFRDLGKRLESQFNRIMNLTGTKPGLKFTRILADLQCSNGLLEKRLQKKQKTIGRSLLDGSVAIQKNERPTVLK